MGKTTPDDVLEAAVEVLEEVEPRPVTTASEIAEKLPVGARTVRNRLPILEARGDVASFQAGASAVVWYLAGEDAPTVPEGDDESESERESALEDERVQEVSVDDQDESEAFDSVDELVGDDVQEESDGLQETPVDVYVVLEEIELPGSGDVLEERREAVGACYELLWANGEATKSKFIDEIYPDHPAGYSSSGGWWNTIGKKGLRDLADDLDEVRAPPEGGHTWRFVVE